MRSLGDLFGQAASIECVCSGPFPSSSPFSPSLLVDVMLLSGGGCILLNDNDSLCTLTWPFSNVTCPS